MRAAVRRAALCAAAGFVLLSCQQTPPPQECSSIEYASAAEALESLLADPSAKRSIQRGWLLFERPDGDSVEYWTFTPENHPAHPSVGMRTGCQGDNGFWQVKTNLICHATKAACDALLEDYLLLDEQLREHLEREHGPGV